MPLAVVEREVVDLIASRLRRVTRVQRTGALVANTPKRERYPPSMLRAEVPSVSEEFGYYKNVDVSIKAFTVLGPDPSPSFFTPR